VDPNTQLIVTSIASGAAGALVQQTLTSGGAWLTERFAGHQAAAKQQAAANVSDFLNELGARVQRMEESNLALHERIIAAMEHPDYSILMQRAVLAAAQTDERDKHILLVQLVSERLRIDENTTPARASHLASEAIAELTSEQLKILGFLYTLETMHFPPLSSPTSPELLRALELEWVQLTLNPYAGLECTNGDRRHLVSARCLGGRFGGLLVHSLESMLKSRTGGEFAYGDFVSTDLGAHLQAMYEGQKLNGMELTSAGSLVGMYVADQLASRPTDITTWAG
jgi:hypothetical protein